MPPHFWVHSSFQLTSTCHILLYIHFESMLAITTTLWGRQADAGRVRDVKCQSLGKRTFVYPCFVTSWGFWEWQCRKKTPNFENQCECATWKDVLMKGTYSHEWEKTVRPLQNFPLHRVKTQLQQVQRKETEDTGDSRFLERRIRWWFTRCGPPNQQHKHYQKSLTEIQILRPHPDLQILNSGDGAQQSLASQALPVILSHAYVWKPLL